MGRIWHVTSALALSAGKHSAVSYDVRHTRRRRAAVRAYPMTMLGHAASSWADGRTQSDGRIRIGIATGLGPVIDQFIAILRVRISPQADTEISVEYIRTSTRGILRRIVLLPYRQNVVIVERTV